MTVYVAQKEFSYMKLCKDWTVVRRLRRWPLSCIRSLMMVFTAQLAEWVLAHAI
jgi:hypothetical protein